MTRYEVQEMRRGRKRITSDCPAQGLLEWPKNVWSRITSRPIGLDRARALADASPTRATVCIWQSAEVAYDNGKQPLVPAGWEAAQ